MERKVIYRDRQEFQAADVNNTQDFVDESLQHIITDAITDERQITGLQVTAKSSTEIEVAPGRLWVGDEGKVYRLDEAQTISVFSYLPLQDQKWLAVSVYGQETDTDTQPRDFLIDLQTGQTEPQAVAMERKREIVTHIAGGLESPDPQKPEPPTGYTLIAYVLLDPGGIQKIELAENKQLPRLFDVNSRLQSVENWKDVTEPRVSTLASDVSVLANKLAGAGVGKIEELAADIARIKEKLDLPDLYSSYSADYFMTDDESDTQNAEYYARIDEGLQFPFAGQTQQQLELFNPYETKVKNYNGLILPAFSDVVRIQTTGYSGSISIGQYQYQTHTMKRMSVRRCRWVCGPIRRVYKIVRWSYYPSPVRIIVTRTLLKPGEDTAERVQVIEKYYSRWPVYSVVKTYVVRKYRRYCFYKSYWRTITTTEQISGSQIAQTFLCSQNGWLTKVGLYFTNIASDGVVYLHVCKTKDGKPDLEQVLGSASVEPAYIQQYPSVTKFELNKPVLLESGERYALVLTTAGDHSVATVSGSSYAEGTLFYSTDGAFFQGDLTKDLMMDLYFAKFNEPYVTVELKSISLSDGIADLDLLAGNIVPDGTDVIFEYQKDGVWYTLSEDGADQLAGLPAMLPLRVTFVGSSDIMPALDFADSTLTASRPATTMKHISTTRSLADQATEVRVTVLIDGWDAAKHTCTIKIRSGGTDYDPASTSDIELGDGQIKRTCTFDFSASPISEYQIIIEGTSATALDVFQILERIDVAI